MNVGIDVSKMDDHELRYYLNEYNILTGPIVGEYNFICSLFNEINQGHTRIIYRRQLLEAITNEINQGNFFFKSSK